MIGLCREVDPLQGIIKDVTRWLRNAVIPRSGANCCTISPDFGEISFYDVGQIWARAARSAGPECLCGRVLTRLTTSQFDKMVSSVVLSVRIVSRPRPQSTRSSSRPRSRAMALLILVCVLFALGQGG